MGNSDYSGGFGGGGVCTYYESQVLEGVDRKSVPRPSYHVCDSHLSCVFCFVWSPDPAIMYVTVTCLVCSALSGPRPSYHVCDSHLSCVFCFVWSPGEETRSQHFRLRQPPSCEWFTCVVQYCTYVPT